MSFVHWASDRSAPYHVRSSERGSVLEWVLGLVLLRTSIIAAGALVAACTPSTEGGSTSGAAGGAPGDGGAGASSDSGSGSSGTSSGGQPVTFGSDVSQAPSSTYRCSDGYPIQINPSFPQPFDASGAQSCTLLTFLPPQGPSPGSGTAVSANIRVGDITGPMRFVRMRILFQNGVGPKCCSLEQYGETFTPQASAATNIALGFSMLEESIPPPSDLTTIAANDLIALEVLSPNVPIPGFWPSNGGAVANIANYLWLPSLSSANTPAPSHVLLNYQGSFSGFVPLFNFVFVPNR